MGELRVGRVRELNEARQRAEQAWGLLVTATQRREALERLRRRQLSIHLCQATRTEQKILDELAGRSPGLAEAGREMAENV